MSLLNPKLPNRGTPKTIDEAIRNGFEESLGKTKEHAIFVMKMNVNDFLAQKFQCAPRGFEQVFIDFFNRAFRGEK